MHQDTKKRMDDIEQKGRKCLILIQFLLNAAMGTLFGLDIGYAVKIIYQCSKKKQAPELNLELLCMLFLSGCIIFLIYRARENAQSLYDFVTQLQALLITSEQDVMIDQKEESMFLDNNHMVERRNDERRQEKPSKRKMRVLIIDDNTVSRLVLRNMLASEPVEIEEAEDGKKGIDILKEKEIDLIFLDYLMPKQNGVEVARKIRESKEAWANIRIVGLSANEDETLREAFEEQGVEELIPKPFAIDRVLACLQMEKKEIKSEMHQENQELGAYKKLLLKPGEGYKVEKSKVRTKLHSYLLSVNGLDYEEGMKYSVGNEEQYEQILELAIQYSKKFVLDLPVYTEQNNQDKILYELHAVRGILAHIGAKMLYTQVEEAEHRIKNEGIVPMAQIEYLIHQITVFQCELEHAISAYNSSETKDSETIADQTSEEEISKLKEQAVFYANNYEYHEMMGALEMLNKTGNQEWKDLIQIAIQAAGTFDYEKVKEILSSIH
ncbi:MAG: response regulator [Lachnospiraceae bacterium]|nr:response regulator [Lachnospiraceae bacterium]